MSKRTLREVGKSRAEVRPKTGTLPRPQTPAIPSSSRTNLWICLFLAVATLIVYAPVRDYSFIDFDDYLFANDYVHVRPGLSAESFKWAFTSGEDRNWLPLTRLSHVLAWQLFGSQSGLHHLANVVIHVLGVVVVFAFFYRATRARWPSAFVALLFALHPLHVESVVWVTERKDVLSAFFWFLALWLYVRYAEKRTIVGYAAVLLTFCLGLLSKMMVVTFPFVLLLMDVWPLKRISIKGWTASEPNPPITAVPWTRALWEKVPFFIISAAASIASYLVQTHGGAVGSLTNFPLGLRIENALVSYVTYLVKMIWPAGLAVFYPYPTHIPAAEAVMDALVLLGISILVLRSFRKFPYLTVGWLWYLGTLVPVIGLVQSGTQARADRFVYIPMVGISFMVAWGASDIFVRWPRVKPAIIAIAAVACPLMVAVTWVDIPYWKDTETIFKRALEVTDHNYQAHAELGMIYMDQPGRLPEALSQWEAAVQINSISAEGQNGLGLALAKTGRIPEGLAHLRTALRIDPNYPDAHNNLGEVLLSTASTNPDRYPEAVAQLQTALRIKPDYADAHSNLGAALLMNGRYAEAVPHLQMALRGRPDSAEVHYNLGAALSYIPGRLPEAIAHLQAAYRINPDPDTRRLLQQLLAKQRQ